MLNILKRNNSETNREPFDINQLEDDIRDTMPRLRPATLMQVQYEPVQEMLEQPQITAADLGKITAESVAKQYECAAEAVAKLGSELSDQINKIERIKLEAQDAMKACLEVAEMYREKGRTSAIEIERTSTLTNEVRDTCDAMRSKIATQ